VGPAPPQPDPALLDQHVAQLVQPGTVGDEQPGVLVDPLHGCREALRLQPAPLLGGEVAILADGAERAARHQHQHGQDGDGGGQGDERVHPG
jgi:hypothetical protein